jgi:hypothetical protein
MVFAFSKATKRLTGLRLSSKSLFVERVFQTIRFLFQKFILKRKEKDIDPTL